MKSRLQLARQLGKQGGSELWGQALAMVLPQAVREIILESIGSSGNPEAGRFLGQYLKDPDQGIRRAAIRGLAATGRAEDAGQLGDLMGRSGLAIEESTEVALALGGSPAPNATDLLLRAYPAAAQEELIHCLLLGLAQRPFGQTQTFFQTLLADPQTEPERKKDVLQALGQFDSVREEYFYPFLENQDPLIRSGAYLGLGVLREGNPGPRLLVCLRGETDRQARLSLLQALGIQPSGDPWAVHQVALAEKEPLRRILAAKAVARSLQGRGINDPAVSMFDRIWVPELARLAIEGSHTEGLQAVSALAGRRSSAEARKALGVVFRQAEDTKVKEAAQKALFSP